MPPSPTRPQIARLQRLLQWLRDGRPLTAKRAAEALDVSRRTIHSDLDVLRELGVPFEYVPARRSYVLTEPFENLPLLPLRRTEWAALLVAQHALQALGDRAHAGLLSDVTQRIAQHLPETVRVEPSTLAGTLRIEPGTAPAAPLPLLEALHAAADEQRIVHLRYHANHRDALTERDVEPYAVLAYQGRWYLVARCRLREAMRDFRLDRIRGYDVRDDVFARDPDFDLSTYLGPAFGMHRGERTYAVHLRFTPYQARWIVEEQWHPSQLMLRRADGSLDVRMQVAGLADVARWVLSYGAECEVLCPPVLRHRVASEARRLAAIYGDPKDPPEDA